MDYKTALRTARKRALTQHPGTNMNFYIKRNDKFKGGFIVDWRPDHWLNGHFGAVYGYYNKQGEHFVIDLPGYMLSDSGELVKNV